jgi:hypothetical protein
MMPFDNSLCLFDVSGTSSLSLDGPVRPSALEWPLLAYGIEVESNWSCGLGGEA